jgi:hypothetical protein
MLLGFLHRVVVADDNLVEVAHNDLGDVLLVDKGRPQVDGGEDAHPTLSAEVYCTISVQRL